MGVTQGSNCLHLYDFTTIANNTNYMLVSIVHDFAVLYSTRVLQNDKKWSDGRLRYYEFNNKIEVVSDSNVGVCSDFYPHLAKPPLENGVFADGNTYTLPSGKLVVQFSEYLGCTERDITKFLNSRSAEVTERPVNREHAKERIERMTNEKRLDGILKIENAKFRNVKVENGYVECGKLDTILTSALGSLPQSVNFEKVSKENLLKAKSDCKKINDPIRVGLQRPKRTRQVAVTQFVKRLTVEEKLCMLDRRRHKIVRIPSGSNRLTVRLYRELGIGHALNEAVVSPIPMASNVTSKGTDSKGDISEEVGHALEEPTNEVNIAHKVNDEYGHELNSDFEDDILAMVERLKEN